MHPLMFLFSQMTKKRKGQDADGEDDVEQCRTPIRSELDKLESKLFPFLLIACSCFNFTVQT